MWEHILIKQNSIPPNVIKTKQKYMAASLMFTYEGFRDKTRYTPFFKSWDKRGKTADFFLFIYTILQPLTTFNVYIFTVSN